MKLFPLRNRKAAYPALLLAWTSYVKAALNVTTPIADQYPRVAHAGHAYSWTLADSTFMDADAGQTIALSASGLPSWVKFDGSSRTFSGTPRQSDVQRTTVTVKAEAGSDQVSDQFDLIVVADDEPILKNSLVRQLPAASSLGKSQILDGTKLHIPWGWSFSVGWQGDTFYLPSGSQVYTYGTIAGNKPLPRWLQYSPTTFAMWGIAPNAPGPEGTEFVFTLTGSNVQGKFGGTQANVTIVLGTGDLSLKGGAFPPMNATVGQAINYTIPTALIAIDGQQVPDISVVNISVDTSKAPWLTYDAVTKQLSGTPSVHDGNVNSSVATSVPVKIVNSLGKALTTEVRVNILAPTFSAGVLPNVFIKSGESFSVSLASFVRDTEQHTVDIALDPPAAGSWVAFNATTLVLSGMAPQMGSSDKIKVTLSSSSRRSSQALRKRDVSDSDPANEASFYIAPEGSNPGSPSPAPKHTSKGLSHSAKMGLAIGFGIVGGIIALLLLVMLARRCCAVEEHDTSGNLTDNGRSPALSDDRTLHGGHSPAMIQDGLWTEKKVKGYGGASPATTAVNEKSPYLNPDYYRSGALSPDSELKGILIGGKHYGYGQQHLAVPTRSDSQTAERPKQHGFMSALVQGAKRRFPSSRSLTRATSTGTAGAVAPSTSAGLGLTGLGLEAPSSDDPYTARPQGHSRSHFSLRSSASRESWEEDLFYPSAPAGAESEQQQHHHQAQSRMALTPVIEVEEVPTRRGSNGRISSRTNPMRHRSSHINASPAFTTPGTFGAPTPSESSQGHGTDEGGDLPMAMSDNYVIGTAQRVDVRDLGQQGTVQSYRPDLTVNVHSSASKHAHAVRHDSGAFDDAEDEEELPTAVDMAVSQSRQPNRNSAMSHVSADSQIAALGPYISYPEPDAGKPPSIFGGASIASNVRPEDTLRVVPNPSYGPTVPSTPPVPARRLSKSPLVENLEASVCAGERVRIKLTPPGGAAMMGGAPGSPGKRSSRGGKYLPVLDDISMQAHGTWPIWLSEWLHWDPRVFELSGEVPLDFQLPEVHIALVHRRPVDTTSTASPHGHRRQLSNDVALPSHEDEVVVRLTLIIDWSEELSGSGHNVQLHREGTGTAF